MVVGEFGPKDLVVEYTGRKFEPAADLAEQIEKKCSKLIDQASISVGYAAKELGKMPAQNWLDAVSEGLQASLARERKLYATASFCVLLHLQQGMGLKRC